MISQSSTNHHEGVAQISVCSWWISDDKGKPEKNRRIWFHKKRLLKKHQFIESAKIIILDQLNRKYSIRMIFADQGISAKIIHRIPHPGDIFAVKPPKKTGGFYPQKLFQMPRVVSGPRTSCYIFLLQPPRGERFWRWTLMRQKKFRECASSGGNIIVDITIVNQ